MLAPTSQACWWHLIAIVWCCIMPRRRSRLRELSLLPHDWCLGIMTKYWTCRQRARCTCQDDAGACVKTSVHPGKRRPRQAMASSADANDAKVSFSQSIFTSAPDLSLLCRLCHVWWFISHADSEPGAPARTMPERVSRPVRILGRDAHVERWRARLMPMTPSEQYFCVSAQKHNKWHSLGRHQFHRLGTNNNLMDRRNEIDSEYGCTAASASFFPFLDQKARSAAPRHTSQQRKMQPIVRRPRVDHQRGAAARAWGLFGPHGAGCWLPLLAKHTEAAVVDGPLVVPLDCEWVWHCHRLSPVK